MSVRFGLCLLGLGFCQGTGFSLLGLDCDSVAVACLSFLSSIRLKTTWFNSSSAEITTVNQSSSLTVPWVHAVLQSGRAEF